MSAELETKTPVHFDREQVALRLLLGIVLGWFGITLGWMTSFLYVLLPLLVAGGISAVGSANYARDFAPQLWSVLAWIIRAEAYMMLIVDRFPTVDEADVRLTVRYSGTPTVASALIRLVTSLPSACVLGLLMVISTPLWVVAAVIVLVGAEMPSWILAYQRGVLRWQLRLLAYHASLVCEYPPWHLHADLPLAQAVAR